MAQLLWQENHGTYTHLGRPDVLAPGRIESQINSGEDFDLTLRGQQAMLMSRRADGSAPPYQDVLWIGTGHPPPRHRDGGVHQHAPMQQGQLRDDVRKEPCGTHRGDQAPLSTAAGADSDQRSRDQEGPSDQQVRSHTRQSSTGQRARTTHAPATPPTAAASNASACRAGPATGS